MGWKEEEEKRLMEDGVERRERLRAQSKKVNRILIIVAFIAAALVAVDSLTRDEGAVLPMDLSNPGLTVAQWTESGFIKSINDTAALVTVDDVVWSGLSEDEKTSVVAFLSSYCEEVHHSEGGTVYIKGHSTLALLAAADSTGITIR